MTAPDPLLLAVYGTLRRGGGGRRRAGLRREDLEALGPCRLRGFLVDLGAYPGLVEAEGDEGQAAGPVRPVRPVGPVRLVGEVGEVGPVGEGAEAGSAKGAEVRGEKGAAAGAATGAAEHGAALVVGELVRCAGPDVLAKLDAFEGFDPAQPWNPLFVRRRRTLVEPAGTAAWVYLFAGEVAGLPRVAGGDWMRR